MASLSAVIIHAIFNMITPQSMVYQFWELSPIEVPLFLVGVFSTIFSTIRISAMILLFLVARAGGLFLDRVNMQSVVVNSLDRSRNSASGSNNNNITKGSLSIGSDDSEVSISARDIFLPPENEGNHNPQIE